MSIYALPRRFLRLCLVISLPTLALASILLLPQIAHAGGEVTDCSNDTDLRARLAGGGLVTFDCGTEPVTITLTATDSPGSHIDINQTTTISGAGLITLQGDGAARIFNVVGSSLTLEGLTITGGRALLTPDDDGGAIYVTGGGSVSVADSQLSDNQAQYGGAVRVDKGVVTVTNSSLFNNQAEFGGAIYVADIAPGSPPINAVTIINSALTGNTASDGDGGAIRVWNSRLTLANSTLSNNRAIEAAGGAAGGDGGGVGVGGTETGGISLVEITNTTMYNNTASANGGGVHIDANTGSGRVKNSIVANNAAPAGANCSAIDLVSDGNNLASDDTCDFDAGGDLTDVDPLLGPLADNGGDTLTHAPLPGSPVINAADNSACAASPVSGVDQRGVSRPQGVTCDIGAVEATADLSLVKSSTSQDGDPVHPSELITYTLEIANSGSLTATNALISDTLPANTSFVPGSIRLTPSGAGTPGVEPPVLASDVTINPSQAVSVTFAVSVNSPLPNQTVITNTASLTSDETPGPLSSTVTDTVSSAPSLGIRKSSLDLNGGALIPGDTISYTIVVTNSGTENATGAVISDALPENTTLVSDSIRLGPPGAGTPGTTLPVLASDLTIDVGQTVTAEFAVNVNLPLPDETLITNVASLTSTQTPSPISSTVTDTVTSAPAWDIRKSSLDLNGGALIPGDTISYTVAVANNGTANATGAIISDTLPANTSFIPGSIRLSPPGAGTPGTGLPTLASNLAIDVGEPVTAAFAVRVDLPLPDGTAITNTASLTSTQTPGPVSSTVTDTVRSVPSLGIRKSSLDVNGGELIPGDTISYTIVMTNSGTANATGALLSDALPANTSFVPGSIRLSPPGAGTPGTGLPVLASDLGIDVGEEVTAEFAVTVNLPLPNQTPIANTASLTSTQTPIPVSSTVTDTVTSAPTLGISKSSLDLNGGELIPGDTISYTIVITNSGTANATGALLSDALPANTTFVPGSIRLSPPGAGTPGTAPPDVASDLTIGPSQPVAVGFAVRVNLPLPNETVITNIASLTSAETPSPISSTVTDTVTSAPSLILDKSVQDATGGAVVAAGDTITYTIVVTNNGTANAIGGRISDILPANTVFVPGSISLSPPGAGTPGAAPPDLASNLTISPIQPVVVTFAATVDKPLDAATIITNTASVTSPDIAVPSSDSVVSTITTTPAISVTKEGPLVVQVGETVVYTFTVTNVGNTLLENVQVVDDRAGPANYLSGDDDADMRLGLTEAWVYTAPYTVQLDDPDPLINTVTVTAADILSREATATDQHSTGSRFFMPIILKDSEPQNRGD